MYNNTQPRQITVSEMSPHVHSFLSGENKVTKISTWLIAWINKSLAQKLIKPYDFLPSKSDLAFHIGVSKGTMQNVFRVVEDAGLVESKQKVGTYIRECIEEQATEKLTSKRELAIEEIKKFIVENDYKKGECLISLRRLSKILNISNTTLRMAIMNLVSQKILVKENNAFIINNVDFRVKKIKTETLVEKVALSIKDYVISHYHSGEKLPPNIELAEKFNTSVKTIHDAIKLLSKEGFLCTKRGQYGTRVLGKTSSQMLYQYEHVEYKIRHSIATDYEVGAKLPSIIDLAQEYNVSTKTIKKALDNLAEDGYVTFTRGRYGGTFVMDIPQEGNEAYKWLAISPEYMPSSEN